MSNLISAAELHRHLHSPALRVVDVRASLSDPEAGQRLYAAAHLPGAVYLNLDDDLAGPVGAHGGRHPLPEMTVFAAKLGALGIGDGSDVVVYDDDGGMFAARLWWLLRYAGSDWVRVLDGSFSAWTAVGFPVTQRVPEHVPATLTLRLRPEMVADMDEVRAKLGTPSVALFDARAPERYRGEVEPLDKKAGHIPGALNKPFVENLEEGHFKSPEALRARFPEAENADEVILYCGSGVSAAHNALALEEAGIPGAKLYVGSWSDWGSFNENPVATGEEP
jgi:thiosulfate/3-mercaptopyruvate sulfurtransferase